jgi:aspartyl-tRNA(Asn)/glutamyl-tRNA(Gln) amidotransferase subunit A
MSLDRLLTQPLSTVAPLLRSREVSAVELTRATLERLHHLNPRSGSFLTILDDQAVAEAAAADAALAAGEYRGPLHGIPYSIKDNIATRGIPSTGGSVILKDYRPTYDATVASRARAAGGVLLGKTNLHEWASGATNDNPHFGRAGNAWAFDHIPGGSSGGSAAAVALGLGYYSFGTDGAGSVRVPAALCGVVGVKATYALVSRHGMIPPVAPGYDHGPGILARSVRDAAAVLNAVVGYDPQDPAAFTFEAPDYAARLEMDLKGLKVGVPTNFYFDLVDPEVEAAVRQAVEVVAGLGAEIEEVHVPFIEEAIVVSGVVAQSDFHRTHLKARRQDYGEDLRYRFLAGEFVLAKDAARAARVREIFKASMQRVMGRYDALLAPVVPVPAFPFDATEVQVGRTTLQTRAPGVLSDLLVRLTRPANFAAISAISVPCGATASGLPIGLQIVGKPHGEPTIFALGHQYGAATGREVCATPPLAAAVQEV